MTKLLLAAVFFLVLLEIAVRAVFPLHEAPGFDRANYSHMGFTPGADSPSALGHASFTWASDPDGFAFDHGLNLYGFRDREWTLAKPPGTTRVAFVGEVDQVPAPKNCSAHSVRAHHEHRGRV